MQVITPQAIETRSVDTAAHEVRMLRARAASLVSQAKHLPEPLATSYRRRATELSLEAHLIDNVQLVRAS